MNNTFRNLCLATLLLALAGCAMTGGSPAPRPKPEPELKTVTGSLEEGLRLARMLRDNGRMEGAVGVYSRLDQRGELKGALLLEYATVAATVQPPRETLALFGRVRQELGGNPQALPPATGVAICNGMGRARLMLGQNDAALTDFDCTLALDPENTVALNGKAVLLDANGAHEPAQLLWRRAQELAPADYNVLNNLAVSYLAQGKAEETIRLLAPLDAPRNVPAVTLNLALAYLLADQPQQARSALQGLVSARVATQLLQELSVYRDRIGEGRPVAQELLAASRRMLALQDTDE